jgi:hypothetical protein
MKTREREKQVLKEIEYACNFIEGGHENAEADYGTPMPTKEAMVEEVYAQVIMAEMVEVSKHRFVKLDIRFLGTEKIRAMIKERLGC